MEVRISEINVRIMTWHLNLIQEIFKVFEAIEAS